MPGGTTYRCAIGWSAAVATIVCIATLGAQPEQAATPVAEAILVDCAMAQPAAVAEWKKAGFSGVVLALDDDLDPKTIAEAARAVASASMTLYLWIEVGRCPTLARSHPELMASLGMHHDWQQRFPGVRKPVKGEVAKAFPWTPIAYTESFSLHLDRIRRLLSIAPANYRGLFLNDLQGGPAACGCGNLQCRWAIDYGVLPTTKRANGPDVAVRFLAEVKKLAKDKEVIPVWTTECEEEDLPREKLPAGGWTTGYCGTVPCLETCRRRFGEQWTALRSGHSQDVGLLLLHKEFQRDRVEYGDKTKWLTRSIDSMTKLPARPLDLGKTWLVVQGYDVSLEEEAKVRGLAVAAKPRGTIVARRRVEQSYEPRIVAGKGDK